MPDIPFTIETKAKSLPLSSHPQPSKKKTNQPPESKIYSDFSFGLSSESCQ